MDTAEYKGFSISVTTTKFRDVKAIEYIFEIYKNGRAVMMDHQTFPSEDAAYAAARASIDAAKAT